MESPHRERQHSIRVLIADDHSAVRQGLRTLLRSRDRFQVCAEADNGREAIAKARIAKPDVALLDVSMPDMNGLEAMRIILKTLPGVEVLILTQCESEGLIDTALQGGARGYMLKSDAGSDLVNAVDALSRHRPFFTYRAEKMVLQGYLRFKGSDGRANDVCALTPREREIVQLLAEGKSNKEVAAAEGISVKTAETHRANIMKKINVNSVCGIVHYAVRNQIITP
ncbi:MAG: response regulator [Terriglobia bacterium]